MPPRTPLQQPLDLGSYAPFYLNTISNRISASASRAYLVRFGIGIAEWRVLANLGGTGRATAGEIARITAMDKSVVSRAVQALERGGHVTTAADAADTRRRTLHLTPGGDALRRRVLRVALDRERALLAGLSAAERATLIGLLRRLHANIAHGVEGRATED